MNSHLAIMILRSLGAHGDEPMHELLLVSACRIAVSPQPTHGDVMRTAGELEAKGYVTALTDPLLGRHYSLTVKGRQKASEM